ncbi:unnamed protein product [Polarella glacialis]|uniref:TAF6 C-terminal HEAT repeat domain-containing protein n=1 Tax=Polarella glacialis TaxID=89957 RepID=A0A813JT94_POLGL|nr:unnamed protein product [Polarella glacialis]CAE8631608.1 unnamed protein product [Polarella glacialis]CAE8684545.1 unnamed protein product [Polarella glacialis]
MGAAAFDAGFACFAARRAGVPAGTVEEDGTAAPELAAQLELRLREAVGLALRLAAKAGRRGHLRSADVADGLGSVAEGSLMSRAACFAAAASVASSAPLSEHQVSLAAELRRPLPQTSSAPLPGQVPGGQVQMRVQWIVADGKAVAEDAVVDAGRADAAPDSGSFAALQALPRPTPKLSEEQLVLLYRITGILEVGEVTSRWEAKALEICAREDFAPLRPLLAEFLAHQVPLRAAKGAPTSELRLLLRALEAVTLAPACGVEAYLHLCLSPAFVLCLGARSRKPQEPATTGPEGYLPGALTDGQLALSRRAASLIACLVRRYAGPMPEFGTEVLRVLREALRRSPPLRTVAGAAVCLTALGPRAVEQVLVPAMCSGLAQHLEVLVNEAKAIKRPRCLAGDAAGAFEALAEAQAALCAEGAAWAATQLSSASAEAFGIEPPGPLLVAMGPGLGAAVDAVLWQRKRKWTSHTEDITNTVMDIKATAKRAKSSKDSKQPAATTAAKLPSGTVTGTAASTPTTASRGPAFTAVAAAAAHIAAATSNGDRDFARQAAEEGLTSRLELLL